MSNNDSTTIFPFLSILDLAKYENTDTPYRWHLYAEKPQWIPVHLSWSPQQNYEQSFYSALTHVGYDWLNEYAQALYGLFETNLYFDAFMLKNDGSLIGEYDEAGNTVVACIHRDGTTRLLSPSIDIFSNMLRQLDLLQLAFSSDRTQKARLNPNVPQLLCDFWARDCPLKVRIKE